MALSKPSHSMPFKLLVLGHSFPRRLAFYTKQAGRHNFQLSSHYNCRVFGVGGLKVPSLQALQFKYVAQHHPHVVFLDIGTNDVNMPNVNPTVLAQQVYDLARTLINRYGVSQVAIFPVLPRDPSASKYTCHPKFNTRAGEYNESLKQCVQAGPSPRQVHFWQHKGLIEDCISKLEDGVHLNNQGMSKYYHSVKRAAVKFANMV